MPNLELESERKKGADTKPRKSTSGLAVKSKLRVQAFPFHISGDFWAAMDEKIIELLNKATERAAENGRKTLKDCDL